MIREWIDGMEMSEGTRNGPGGDGRWDDGIRGEPAPQEKDKVQKSDV